MVLDSLSLLLLSPRILILIAPSDWGLEGKSVSMYYIPVVLVYNSVQLS